MTALWSMALVGTTPIGSPVIGALSDAAGPRYALALGAAACLAAAVVGRWPARGANREPGQASQAETSQAETSQAETSQAETSKAEAS